MKLYLDGMEITAAPGESLLELATRLGLVTDRLSTTPLAARIAGEVFTLNYIPLREKDAAQDRPSMRRAMAAAGGKVQLLRYGDTSGKDAYAPGEGGAGAGHGYHSRRDPRHGGL